MAEDENGELQFRTDPRTGRRYPLGVSVESVGRKRFGMFRREGPARPWFVRLRDEDGRVFNLKVTAHNEDEARQKVLQAFPRVTPEMIIRASPHKEGLTKTVVRTLGRATAEELRKFLTED